MPTEEIIDDQKDNVSQTHQAEETHDNDEEEVDGFDEAVDDLDDEVPEDDV